MPDLLTREFILPVKQRSEGTASFGLLPAHVSSKDQNEVRSRGGNGC